MDPMIQTSNRRAGRSPDLYRWGPPARTATRSQNRARHFHRHYESWRAIGRRWFSIADCLSGWLISEMTKADGSRIPTARWKMVVFPVPVAGIKSCWSRSGSCFRRPDRDEYRTTADLNNGEPTKIQKHRNSPNGCDRSPSGSQIRHISPRSNPTGKRHRIHCKRTLGLGRSILGSRARLDSAGNSGIQARKVELLG